MNILENDPLNAFIPDYLSEALSSAASAVCEVFSSFFYGFVFLRQLGVTIKSKLSIPYYPSISSYLWIVNVHSANTHGSGRFFMMVEETSV